MSYIPSFPRRRESNWVCRLMNKIPACAGMTLLLLASMNSQAASAFNQVKYAITDNGTHFAYLHTPTLPIVDIRLAFHAGSAYDGSHPGLAKLSASLIGQGTHQLDADQIASGFDQVGAIYSSHTTRDLTVFSLRTLSDPKYLKSAVGLFVRSIAKPAVMPHVFDEVKARQAQQILAQQQIPSALAYNTLYKAMFAGTPYAHCVDGSIESLDQLTMSESARFYRQYYVAHNANIVIVGSISFNQAARIANKISAAFKTGKQAKTLFVHAKTPAKTLVHVPFNGSQSTVLVAEVGLSKLAKNRQALNLAAQALGGGGFSSVLYNELREKQGLVYHVSAQNTALEATGVFSVFAQTAKPAKVLQLIKSAENKLATNGFEPAQIDQAKTYLAGRFAIGFTSNRDFADTLISLLAHGFARGYMANYVSKLKQVSLSDASGIFEKIIHSEHSIIIIVGQNE